MRKDKGKMYGNAPKKNRGKNPYTMLKGKRRHMIKKGLDKDSAPAKKFYGSYVWKQARSRQLSDYPLCERCKKQGKIQPATTVHHRWPLNYGGDQLAQENLMSICGEACHRAEHREIEEAIAEGRPAW